MLPPGNSARPTWAVLTVRSDGCGAVCREPRPKFAVSKAGWAEASECVPGWLETERVCLESRTAVCCCATPHCDSLARSQAARHTPARAGFWHFHFHRPSSISLLTPSVPLHFTTNPSPTKQSANRCCLGHPARHRQDRIDSAAASRRRPKKVHLRSALPSTRQQPCSRPIQPHSR